MKYKKCPICEINYILENEEKCEVCKEKIMYDKNNIVNKGRKTNPIAEKFTFKNEKVFYRGKNGFQAYNEKGENVGLVYMCDDKRWAAYGKCQLCIYGEYQKEYGQWRIVKSHGAFFDWVELCNYFTSKESVVMYLD